MAELKDPDRDPYFDSGSYIDSDAFKAYTARIRELIYQAEGPVSIGDIHRMLRSESCPSWTADALDSIRDIESVGLLPTRYRPLTRPIAGLHKPANERWEIGKPGPKEPYQIEGV